MSESKGNSGVKIVTYERFVEVIKDIGINIVCPICKSENWIVHAETPRLVEGKDTFTSAVIPFGTSGDFPTLLPKEGENFLILVCEDCGFSHFFHRDTFLAKIKRMHEKTGDTE
ncbi:hypothetical protein ACMWRF_000413 [Enterobacter hormaechei]|nr:hypothetical protein [Enterobacter hormaechei]